MRNCSARNVFADCAVQDVLVFADLHRSVGFSLRDCTARDVFGLCVFSRTPVGRSCTMTSSPRSTGRSRQTCWLCGCLVELLFRLMSRARNHWSKTNFCLTRVLVRGRMCLLDVACASLRFACGELERTVTCLSRERDTNFDEH